MSLDGVTIGLYVVLLFWGWFSVCGACYDYHHPDLFSFELNSGKQFVWILSSLLLAGALLLIEKRFYYKSSMLVYALMMFLLLLTIFIAPDTKGSRSWIPLGPVKLQPAEFAKFAVALAVGKLMERYGFRLSNSKDFMRVVVLFILPMLLIIAQKETGTALVYLAFFLVLYREGMTGSVLFAAFMFITYVVVGVKFGDEHVDGRHFSPFSFEHNTAPGAEMADAAMVRLMNPVTHILEGNPDVTPHWRVRHGSFDRDTSLAIPVILATLLKNRGFDVDFALPWGLPHSGDYDLDALFSWIDNLCA